MTDSVKTEQHPMSRTDSILKRYREAQNPNNKINNEVKSEEPVIRQRRRNKKIFLIGRLYLDGRFPFFHIERYHVVGKLLDI